MIDSTDHRLPEPLRKLLPPGLQALCASSPCTRGELLFKQGKKPARMLFVTSGEVVLQRLGRKGENVVLQRMRWDRKIFAPAR